MGAAAVEGAVVIFVVPGLYRRGIRRRLPRASSPTYAALRRVGRLVRRIAGRRAALPAYLDDEQLGHHVALALLGALLLAASAHGPRVAAALPLGALLGWHAAAAVRDRAARARQAAARAALPTALDRLATSVLSGLSIERAMRLVAPGVPGPLGDALTHGLRALELGVPRMDAYRLVGERAGAEEVRGVMEALARAERFGSSVATTLVAEARELRSKARAAAEEEARTAPLKMVFPLVFCFLPAFVVLTIAPIAISAIRTLGGL